MEAPAGAGRPGHVDLRRLGLPGRAEHHGHQHRADLFGHAGRHRGAFRLAAGRTPGPGAQAALNGGRNRPHCRVFTTTLFTPNRKAANRSAEGKAEEELVLPLVLATTTTQPMAGDSASSNQTGTAERIGERAGRADRIGGSRRGI